VRLEKADRARGQADLAERPDQVGPPPLGERRRDRRRPRRPLTLDRVEEQAGNSLIACRLRQLGSAEAVGQGPEGAGGGEVAQQTPRL